MGLVIEWLWILGGCAFTAAVCYGVWVWVR